MALDCFECENLRKMLGVVGAVDTLRVSERRVDKAEDEFLGVMSPSFLSFLNSWLLVLRMFLTKLLTRSRFRGGDGLGPISGLEWFGFGLEPGVSCDREGDGQEGGEENGEDTFFITLLTESTLSRLRSREGAGSSSGLEGILGLDGDSASGGRCGEGGCGEANGDLRVFTMLFTLSCLREGVSECSSWAFESVENGEKTGERNGEGRGMDMT